MPADSKDIKGVAAPFVAVLVHSGHKQIPVKPRPVPTLLLSPP